jgi:glycosyltransferase involved in cell wall biosynthesis
MRILLTNIILADRTGTEVVILELARGLARRGHQVAVFTPVPGASATALAADGITVASRVEDIPFRPDVIHGHHNIAVAPALARFPDVPALFVSHDAAQARDAQLLSPQIVRFFAVDEINRERVLRETAALTKRVDLLPNVVDLDRFKPRAPLPPRPLRTLIVAKNSEHVDAVRTAARAAGLPLDELGLAVGRVVDDLNVRFHAYDLVFTSARAALEALAVGCAVVVVDGRGLAGLATADKVDEWRHHNFGLRLLTRKPTVEALRAEIARYDARDAAAVSARIRALAGLSDHLPRLEQIYQDMVTNWSCSSDDLRRNSEAVGTFFAAWLSIHLPAHYTLAEQCNELWLEVEGNRAILKSRSGLVRQLWRMTTRKLRGVRPG